MERLWSNLATLNQLIGNLSLSQTSQINLTMLRHRKHHRSPSPLSQTSYLIEVTSICLIQPRSTRQRIPTKVFRANPKPTTTRSCRRLATSCSFTSRKSPVASRNFTGDTVLPGSDKRSHGSSADTSALPQSRTVVDLLTDR